MELRKFRHKIKQIIVTRKKMTSYNTNDQLDYRKYKYYSWNYECLGRLIYIVKKTE